MHLETSENLSFSSRLHPTHATINYLGICIDNCRHGRLRNSISRSLDHRLDARVVYRKIDIRHLVRKHCASDSVTRRCVEMKCGASLDQRETGVNVIELIFLGVPKINKKYKSTRSFSFLHLARYEISKKLTNIHA